MVGTGGVLVLPSFRCRKTDFQCVKAIKDLLVVLVKSLRMVPLKWVKVINRNQQRNKHGRMDSEQTSNGQ